METNQIKEIAAKQYPYIENGSDYDRELVDMQRYIFVTAMEQEQTNTKKHYFGLGITEGKSMFNSYWFITGLGIGLGIGLFLHVILK